MDDFLLSKNVSKQLSQFGREEILQLKRDVLSSSLKAFLKYFWPIIEGQPFVDGWILDAKCEHLEALERGQIKRLIINEPPRHAKSTLSSVMFPAWRWARDPSVTFMCLSYGAILASKDAIKMRRIIESDRFQELWPLSLYRDQNTKNKFQNDKNGFRMTTSMRGQIIGEGARCIIADDPNGPESLYSIRDRQEVWAIWKEVLGPRDNDPKNPCRLVIQQRLAEDDLTGNLLTYEPELWEILKLPVEYNPRAISYSSSLGFKDPRTVPGEILWPERFNRETIDKMRKEMANTAPGQLDQEPVAVGGGIFPVDAWTYYDRLPVDIDYFSVWGDLTFKGEVENDYCALVVAGHKGDCCYPIHMVSGKWDFNEQVLELRTLYAKFPWIVHWYLEDAGNAPAVAAVMQELGIHGIQLVPAKQIGNKDYMWGCGKHMVSNKQIQLPTEGAHLVLPNGQIHEVDWDIRDRQGSLGVQALVIEAGKVPKGRNDDMIDALMKVALWARVNPVFNHCVTAHIPGFTSDTVFSDIDRKRTSDGEISKGVDIHRRLFERLRGIS